MPLYEHIFMTQQNVSGQQVDALTEQFKSVIEQNGGTVAKVENWGLKSLAYRVRKNRKAYFTLMNIDAPPAAVAEMERQERLNEDVLRALTLKVDEHEEGPSVMMQKRDRDDRRDDRRGRFGDRGFRSDRDRPKREDAEEARETTTASPSEGDA